MRTDPLRHLVVHRPAPKLTLDLILALRDRSSRDRLGLYLAEGFRFLHSASSAGAPVAGIALCSRLMPPDRASEIRKAAQEASCPLWEVAKDHFRTLTHSHEPSGLLLVLAQTWEPLPRRSGRHDLWLGVEHLRTPGNLGTLLRSAAAFGATGLMVFGPSRDRTDPFDPLCVRASMGAIHAMKIVATTHQEFRHSPSRYEWRVLGADADAPTDVRKVALQKATILMLGAERRGLSEAQLETCDGFVRIPMEAGTDSLNVAMAGTVLLYEVFAQRHGQRRPGPPK